MPGRIGSPRLAPSALVADYDKKDIAIWATVPSNVIISVDVVTFISFDTRSTTNIAEQMKYSAVHGGSPLVSGNVGQTELSPPPPPLA